VGDKTGKGGERKDEVRILQHGLGLSDRIVLLSFAA
jgi:hypothetical protein